MARRRTRTAAATKVAATGLSVGATLAGVGLIAHADATPSGDASDDQVLPASTTATSPTAVTVTPETSLGAPTAATVPSGPVDAAATALVPLPPDGISLQTQILTTATTGPAVPSDTAPVEGTTATTAPAAKVPTGGGGSQPSGGVPPATAAPVAPSGGAPADTTPAQTAPQATAPAATAPPATAPPATPPPATAPPATAPPATAPPATAPPPTLPPPDTTVSRGTA